MANIEPISIRNRGAMHDRVFIVGAAVGMPPDNGLRDIGRMMGLSDAQIDMAMGIVGGMTAQMEQEETPPSE